MSRTPFDISQECQETVGTIDNPFETPIDPFCDIPELEDPDFIAHNLDPIKPVVQPPEDLEALLESEFPVVPGQDLCRPSVVVEWQVDDDVVTHIVVEPSNSDWFVVGDTVCVGIPDIAEPVELTVSAITVDATDDQMVLAVGTDLIPDPGITGQILNICKSSCDAVDISLLGTSNGENHTMPVVPGPVPGMPGIPNPGGDPGDPDFEVNNIQIVTNPTTGTTTIISRPGDNWMFEVLWSRGATSCYVRHGYASRYDFSTNGVSFWALDNGGTSSADPMVTSALDLPVADGLYWVVLRLIPESSPTNPQDFADLNIELSPWDGEINTVPGDDQGSRTAIALLSLVNGHLEDVVQCHTGPWDRPIVKLVPIEPGPPDDDDYPLAMPTSGTEALSETALTDNWEAGAGRGLEVWNLTRVVYKPEGDKKLYGFYRKYTYTKNGQLFSVSDETRVELHTTVAMDVACTNFVEPT
jgi:hypothetical protein